MGMESFFIKLGFKSFTQTPTDTEINNILKSQLKIRLRKKSGHYIYKSIKIMIDNPPSNEIALCGIFIDYNNGCNLIWDIACAIHQVKAIEYFIVYGKIGIYKQDECFTPLIKEVYKEKYTKSLEIYKPSEIKMKILKWFYFYKPKFVSPKNSTILIQNIPVLSNKNIIIFGNYEWYVLTKNDNGMLILMKDIFMLRAYHEKSQEATWESCDLRTYLNTQFYNTFSIDEQNRILPIIIKNTDNALYGTEGGNNTNDKIFLLSLDEAEEFFLNMSELIAGYNGEAWRWWLRSPGFRNTFTSICNAIFISENGYVYKKGSTISNNIGGIRPALWIKI